MAENRIVARNVTLTAEQIALVEAVRKQQYLESFAAALRWVIQRWRQLDPAAPQSLGLELEERCVTGESSSACS